MGITDKSGELNEERSQLQFQPHAAQLLGEL
jgi:hypothetical protein